MTPSNRYSSPNQSENDLQRRHARFEALSMELAEKELELATLQNELAGFETRYARTVGVLFAELDMLDGEIAKELFRIHPEEKYKQGFQNAERKAKTSQKAVDENLDQDEHKAFTPSDELKSLFRKVAKTIHPDLATNEDERAYRTLLMARANAAYRNGDKEALEKILFEWEHRKENPSQDKDQPDKFDQLEKKIAQIMLRLVEIKSKIEELKNSDLHQLMMKVRQAEEHGQDLLSEMANNLQRQIRAAKELLNNLQQQEKG